MTLPTWLGIGAMKAGTTSLHALMKAHPGVAVPPHRKEVMFFDHQFHKGLEWYAEQFANAGPGAPGEITPNYLFDPEVPARVAEALPGVRLIVQLRNPVKRAHSQYKHFVRERNYQAGFPNFLLEHPNAIERGHYHEQLQRWLDHVDREQLLVVLFEDFTADPGREMQRVYAHIGVDAGFEVPLAAAHQNKAGTPRYPRVQAAGRRVTSWMYAHDLEWAVSSLKAAGVQRLLQRQSGAKATFPQMDRDTLERLESAFAPDVAALSSWLGRDLAEVWGLRAASDASEPA